MIDKYSIFSGFSMMTIKQIRTDKFFEENDDNDKP